MADTTLYVIAYDISHNRRRTKVHKLLCGYGTWTQYSLFECWLTKRHIVELRAKLNKLLDPADDSVRLYAICGSCVERTITIGSPKPQDDVLFMV